jgi:hypothetical protein
VLQPFQIYPGIASQLVYKALPSRSFPLHSSPLRIRVTLRLAVYRQSVLGAKPLETRDQQFCSTEPLCNIFSENRMSLSFTIAAGPRQRSHSPVRVPRDSWHISLSQNRDSPNLEDQVPVFIFRRNRVVQLYPQALGSLFVASYDSQGYDGGIRTHLHTADSSSSSLSQGQSQSYFTTDGLPPITSSLRQAPLRLATSNFIFQLNTCGYSPYVTSSLMRSWVCLFFTSHHTIRCYVDANRKV